MILGERIGCWGKLGGGADRKLGCGRHIGEKREDMAVERSIVRKDILVKLLVGDARSIIRRTMWGFLSNVATLRRPATAMGLKNGLHTVRASIRAKLPRNWVLK